MSNAGDRLPSEQQTGVGIKYLFSWLFTVTYRCFLRHWYLLLQTLIYHLTKFTSGMRSWTKVHIYFTHLRKCFPSTRKWELTETIRCVSRWKGGLRYDSEEWCKWCQNTQKDVHPPRTWGCCDGNRSRYCSAALFLTTFWCVFSCCGFWMEG